MSSSLTGHSSSSRRRVSSSYNGASANINALYEFLEDAELQHHYLSLKNVLRVQSVAQLRNILEDDLVGIGMSKSEALRLRVRASSVKDGFGAPGTYASRLRRLLMPKKTSVDSSNTHDARQEFLLGNDDDSAPSFNNQRHLNRRHSSAGTDVMSQHPLVAALGISQPPTATAHTGGIRVPSQQIIPANAITVVKELGAGEFGVVQQGVWTDENGRRHQVAVKCLSKERMQNNTLEFMKEYEIMQSIEHANIVRLFGIVASETSQILLITELAPLRSLLECLKELSLRSTFNVPVLSDFAKQICEGMRYLEAKRLIHRDLAARNVLVFSKDTVKISDFGLSRALGVGKDYYQTNFNANLKLPIAWCAPECINFLKFTSASDVWAYAVTLWEMFSYGFQPWAAQTGQQILEAIDEPNCQRLEQPLHCPKELYAVMNLCWCHEVDKRPTFDQLAALIDEAKPEQVQAVASSSSPMITLLSAYNPLDLIVGDVITVLDKQSDELWYGVHNINGKVGYFSPANTVAYLGTLPSSHHSKWQNEEFHHGDSGGSNFLRNSLKRGSKGKKKLSRDMISGPRGEVQHTGHIGLDGAFFGDVGFIGSAKAVAKSAKSASLSRADSDASERAPLISAGTARHSSSTASSAAAPGATSYEPPLTTVASGPLTAPAASSAKPRHGSGGANKNPRMGKTIGYLRKAGGGGVGGGGEQSQQAGGSAATSNKAPHEYHSISDDEFGLGSLDLGPSLMDEVFSELDSSKDSAEIRDGGRDDPPENHEREKEAKKTVIPDHHRRDFKELVSSTLTLGKMKKQKQQATVKPIKASDERTLENAIAMANAIASKSMHDLDKRHLDDFYPEQPCQTPNSPAKKFSFWFPGGGGASGGGERRHFSDEANANADIESLLTPGAKDAYKVLIEGGGIHKMAAGEEVDASSRSPRSPMDHHRTSCPPPLTGRSSSMSPPPPPPHPLVQHPVKHSSEPPPVSHSQMMNAASNPLPLPPKSQKLQLSQPPKRHVRKNPLIIPSGMAANLLRREAVEDTDHCDFQVEGAGVSAASAHHAYQSFSEISRQQRKKEPSPFDNPVADAFEDEIACSMDALDNIGGKSGGDVGSSPMNSLTVAVVDEDSGNKGMSEDSDSVPLVGSSSLSSDFWSKFKNGRKVRDVGSDEVRIMQKVLGGDVESEDCVAALSLCDWNVHHAIKLIKVKKLIRAPGLTDADMKVALQTRDWDVSKAASVLMKKIKE